MNRIPKKDFFTIPNLIGYLRLALIPVFCWIYVHAQTSQDYMLATGIVLFSSFTDLFDGLIARKCNQITELGKFLDPLADKLTHCAMVLCLATRYPLMWAMLGLLVVKEGYMAVMGLKFLKFGKKLDGAKWFGKVCTAVLFAGMVVLFFFYDMSPAPANIMICLMMGTMVFAFAQYISVFRKMGEDIS